MRIVAVLLLVTLCVVCVLTGCSRSGARESSKLKQARADMVARLSHQWGITDGRVLDAMASVPRQHFLPEDLWDTAYTDTYLVGSDGQSLPSPVLVARAMEELEPHPKHTMLLVDVENGYAAAVASRLCGRVIALVMSEAKAETIRSQLEDLDIGNVEVRAGDTAQGYPPGSPYRCVLVNSGGPQVPYRIYEQLGKDGVVVQFAEPYATDMRVTRYENNELSPVSVVSIAPPR